MTNHRDPWLSLVQRISYVVAPVRLPPSLSFESFSERIALNFERVHGLCTGRFFAMSPDTDVMIGIKNKEIALINLWSKMIAVDLEDPKANPIVGDLGAALAELNRLFACEKNERITIEGIRQEISARSAN